MSTVELTTHVAHLLSRAPEWARRDLAAKDAQVRARAEDTLAAMIANALSGLPHENEGQPRVGC